MNLTALSSTDLKRMLSIKLEIEQYDKELLAIYEKAKRSDLPLTRKTVCGVLRCTPDLNVVDVDCSPVVKAQAQQLPRVPLHQWPENHIGVLIA